MVFMECRECGKVFQGRADAVFCSQVCQNRAYRKRLRARAGVPIQENGVSRGNVTVNKGNITDKKPFGAVADTLAAPNLPDWARDLPLGRLEPVVEADDIELEAE